MNLCPQITPPSEATATPEGVRAPNGTPVYGMAVRVNNKKPKPQSGKAKKKDYSCS